MKPPSELHVNNCGFFYDDSGKTVPMQLKSAVCLVKILFKTATFRVYLAATDIKD
jgi:hypothetical protein